MSGPRWCHWPSDTPNPLQMVGVVQVDVAGAPQTVARVCVTKLPAAAFPVRTVAFTLPFSDVRGCSASLVKFLFIPGLFKNAD